MFREDKQGRPVIEVFRTGATGGRVREVYTVQHHRVANRERHRYRNALRFTRYACSREAREGLLHARYACSR